MDQVFKALADQTRRYLLDRLREHNGQTLGELCERVEMTRQSATRHLAILEAANLISTVRRGREKLHYLDPVPLHEIQQRWIDKFERPRLRALSALKRRAEEDMTDKPTFVYVTYIESIPDKVWHALTDADLTAEYWGHSNVSDWQVGSPWEHQRTDGTRTADVVGTVMESAAPTRFGAHCGQARRGPAPWPVPAHIRHPAARRDRTAHRYGGELRRRSRTGRGRRRMARGVVQPQIPPGDRSRPPANTLGDAPAVTPAAGGGVGYNQWSPRLRISPVMAPR
ncbi:MAG: ArsR/SmtB family transcription factor [Pseudonocardiaceae bacterium]